MWRESGWGPARHWHFIFAIQFLSLLPDPHSLRWKVTSTKTWLFSVSQLRSSHPLFSKYTAKSSTSLRNDEAIRSQPTGSPKTRKLNRSSSAVCQQDAQRLSVRIYAHEKVKITWEMRWNVRWNVPALFAVRHIANSSKRRNKYEMGKKTWIFCFIHHITLKMENMNEMSWTRCGQQTHDSDDVL